MVSISESDEFGVIPDDGVSCGGVILDDEWILTSEACCKDALDGVANESITIAIYDSNNRKCILKTFSKLGHNRNIASEDGHLEEWTCLLRQVACF